MEQGTYSLPDVVADRADGGEAESSGIGKIPVEVAPAGVHGAGVAAAHGDDDIGGPDLVAGQRLGELAGQVEADLGHGLDDGGVDLAGGLGPGGGHADLPGGLVVEQGGGHLGPAGIVDADEEHVRDAGHGGRLSPCGRGTVTPAASARLPGYSARMIATARAPPMTWAPMKAGA